VQQWTHFSLGNCWRNHQLVTVTGKEGSLWDFTLVCPYHWGVSIFQDFRNTEWVWCYFFFLSLSEVLNFGFAVFIFLSCCCWFSSLWEGRSGGVDIALWKGDDAFETWSFKSCCFYWLCRISKKEENRNILEKVFQKTLCLADNSSWKS